MLIDELKEQLKAVEPDIETIKQYWLHAGIDDDFNTLEKESTEQDFWQRSDQAEILKRIHELRSTREQYYGVINSYDDMNEMVDVVASDEAELIKLKSEINQLCKTIKSFKVSLLLNDPQDNSTCFVSINAGAGGTESQDWANILLRMYMRFCERERLNAEVIDIQFGEEAGIKSATLYIKGRNAHGLLKAEHGVHRLVRISPYDSSKRRHTSFAGVHVTPEVPDIEVSINPKDLRVDTYRASGAGGQHVNKTDSAVRITHLPTNIVVQCQNERSQIQNRETAMKMLIAKLAQKQKDEQAEQLSSSIEKKKIEWGSQIRSYVLHPYKMVKDHRTDYESPQPELVLDGDLMPFIETYLLQQQTATL
jgi:peptide chain release factor 2